MPYRGGDRTSYLLVARADHQIVSSLSATTVSSKTYRTAALYRSQPGARDFEVPTSPLRAIAVRQRHHATLVVDVIELSAAEELQHFRGVMS